MAKKIVSVLFLILLILLLTMVGVNEQMGEPSKEYSEKICTRYCHDLGDNHTAKDSWVKEPFDHTVNLLTLG